MISLFNHTAPTFKQGIHPAENKSRTHHLEINRMPFVAEYVLPLSQHIGKPSRPLVRKGEKVKRGQLIAEPDGWVSVALHSPVDGVVDYVGLITGPSGTEQPAIKIKSDQYSAQEIKSSPVDVESLNFEEFIHHVQHAGIVGLGGAAFPAHVKFKVPEGKQCHTIILNGCECEPYLTSDDRLMTEFPGEVIDGLQILGRQMGVKKLVIALEDNKPEAIENLKLAAKSSFPAIEIMPLKTKYPQGAEKMMITALTGEEVPSGALPIDLGMLVSNVGTAVAISRYFRSGHPLVERVITVTGDRLMKPSNLWVPIGTGLDELISHCGGNLKEIDQVILGGPMMGMVQKKLNSPVVKGTSGVLINRPLEEYQDIQACIRCGRCVDACPLFLNPARMGLMARKKLWDEMEEINVLDCFECGSCSYVCPSNIPLVQHFRVAKGFIRESKMKATK